MCVAVRVLHSCAFISYLLKSSVISVAWVRGFEVLDSDILVMPEVDGMGMSLSFVCINVIRPIKRSCFIFCVYNVIYIIYLAN